MSAMIPNGGPVEDVPAELRALPQWVAWRRVLRDGKATKVPINPLTGKGANCNDPATWTTFDIALAFALSDDCDGVSFALSPTDPFTALDLDDVIDPDSGEIDADAINTVDRFETYAELSPSRLGIHLLLRGDLTSLTGRKRADRECYDRARFMTVTGLRASAHAVNSRQEILNAWHAEIWPPIAPSAPRPPSVPLDTSDSERIERIRGSKQGPKFVRLWSGDTEGFTSGSEADLALCSILSFWWQRDSGAVDRLFRASGLMRPKWDSRRGQATYGENTVSRAVKSSASYDPSLRPLRIVPPTTATPGTDGAGWEPIIPLPGLPGVPCFPIHVLPPDLADFVADVAATTNTPLDYPACFALAIAAGVVGATHALDIKRGHVQRSSVFLVAVAQKGSGKTPALDAVAAPVYDRQARLHREKEKKAKAFVSDVTAEKLAEVLNDNRRGVLMIRDELASWLASFNQYKAGGKGSDRQFYLSAWSSSAVSVDRKNKDSEPLYVRFPCLSVVGTIQPAVFDRFRGDADDGFYDRVLFTFPDELPLVGEQWKEIDQSRADRWSEALADLSAMRMRERTDGSEHPHFLALTPDARGVWQEWTEWVATTVNGDDFDPAIRGPAVKLSGYAARLALVCHMLRKAYGEPVRDEIDADDMSRGADLGRYFLGHSKRAWAAVGLDGRHTSTQRLVQWVRDRNGAAFTRRDAHRALHRVFQTSEMLTQPLYTLVSNCYLRYRQTATDSTQTQTAGRPTATTYEINPELCQRVTTVNASPPRTVVG